MSLYTTCEHSSTAPQDPAWIVFCAGPYAARMPVDDATDNLWRYVLDITAMGFRADRVGNQIVITSCPANRFGGLLI